MKTSNPLTVIVIRENEDIQTYIYFCICRDTLWQQRT